LSTVLLFHVPAADPPGCRQADDSVDVLETEEESAVVGIRQGSGCGLAVLAMMVVPVGLAGLVLHLAGADGWLALSTAATVAVLFAALALGVVALLTDQVPQPLPRRVHLAWLLPVIPLVALASTIAAWITRNSGLAPIPWIAGAALAVTAAVVLSGLATD
jgi:hypothetical protein